MSSSLMNSKSFPLLCPAVRSSWQTSVVYACHVVSCIQVSNCMQSDYRGRGSMKVGEHTRGTMPHVFWCSGHYWSQRSNTKAVRRVCIMIRAVSNLRKTGHLGQVALLGSSGPSWGQNSQVILETRSWMYYKETWNVRAYDSFRLSSQR